MEPWATISPFAGRAVVPRLAVLALIVLILSVPINDFWRFLLLTVAVMAVCFGRVRLQPLRWLVALAIALTVVVVSWLLPGPGIEEGHNVYIPVGASLDVFEKELPPDAQQAMREIFDRGYLREGAQLPGSPEWWRDPRFQRPGRFAKHAFAPSADALWQRPKYSRTVDAIDFRSQDQARLDVINRKWFNFHPGTKHKPGAESFDVDARIKRTAMPFFVMVETNPAMVGGTICWRGDTLWEQDSGHYDLRHNPTRSCSEIGPEQIGKHVFALAITPDAPRDFTVQANLQQRLLLWFKSLLRTVGVLLALYLLVRVDAPGQLLLPVAAVSATVLTTLFYWRDLASGFRTYDGGNDGLTHESIGFDISQAVAHGDFWTALRGGEDVFYFMPGLRYLRAVEDFLFGSTGYGMVLCTMFIPIFVYLLLRRLLPLRWCVALLILFLFIPILERFGFAQFLYVREMWKGFPEPIGYGAFLAALALIAYYVPTRMGRPLDGPMPTFWVGLALAVSIAARPNLAIAALLVLAMLGLWLLVERRIASLAGLALGFAPVLFIPWHNWYFGGAFVPLTSSASNPVNLITSPSTYVAAFGEMLRLDFTGPNLNQVLVQLGNWNHWTESVRLVPVLVTLLVVFQRSYAVSLRALALVALSLQAILFFYSAKGRYAYFAWLLVFIVFLVALRENILPWMTKRFPHLSSRIARWPGARQLANLVGSPRWQLAHALNEVAPPMESLDGLKLVCRPLVSPLRDVLEKIPRGSRVFDIGCGAGGLLYLARTRRGAADASGYDVSRRAVDAAKCLPISTGLQIEHRTPQQGVPDLSGADIVTLCDVLHHLPDRLKGALLTEVARTMRPGASLIVADIDADRRFCYWMNQLHDLIVSKEWVAPLRAQAAHELILSNGMTILTQESVRSMWYAHYLIVAEKPRVS